MTQYHRTLDAPAVPRIADAIDLWLPEPEPDGGWFEGAHALATVYGVTWPSDLSMPTVEVHAEISPDLAKVDWQAILEAAGLTLQHDS